MMMKYPISFYLILATIALSPWYIVRFSIWGVPTTLLEVLAISAIVAWLIELVIKGGASNMISQIKNSPRILKAIAALAIIFGFAGALSVVISPNLVAALGIYKAYILEPVVFGAILYLSIKDKSQLGIVAGAVGLAALQVALLAISQHLWGVPNITPTELSQGRSSAMYNTANAIGLFIGPIALASLFIGIWGSVRGRRTLATISFALYALFVAAILTSDSDGANIAVSATMFIGFAAYVIVRRLPRRAIFGTALLSTVLYVGATIGYMWFVNSPPTVVNPYARPGFSTLTVRQCTWEGTTAVLSQQPLAGTGLAGFTPVYKQNITCDAEPLVYPHNIVLNFWTETGMLGLISIMLLVILWLSLGLAVMQQEDAAWLGVAIVSTPIYWLIHGLVDVPYFKNDLSMIWWVLLAMAAAVYVATSQANSKAANATQSQRSH